MKITDAQLKQIYAQAKESYPHECCGFLLGDFVDGGLVREVRQTINQDQEPTTHFVISAIEYGQVQFAAEEAGLEIIGVYHSHPDYPPIPSQTDMNEAWPDAYFLIVSVHEGMPLNTNVWRLAAEGVRRFEGVGLEIVDEREFMHDG